MMDKLEVQTRITYNKRNSNIGGIEDESKRIHK